MKKEWERRETLRKVQQTNVSRAAYLAKRGDADRRTVENARRISK